MFHMVKPPHFLAHLSETHPIDVVVKESYTQPLQLQTAATAAGERHVLVHGDCRHGLSGVWPSPLFNEEKKNGRQFKKMKRLR